MSPRICTVVLLLSAFAQAETNRFEWRRGEGAVALIQAGQVVWQFQYGSTLPKPMFHPVALPGGPVLTLDSPSDHKWHHAFWFAWKYLNGLNYWEEREDEPRGITSWKNVKITTAPDGRARITLDVLYHPPGKPALLTELRVVRVSPPGDGGRYEFEWESVFTAGDEPVVLSRTPIVGEPEGKGWGGYAGLSWRFSQGLGDWQVVYANGDTALQPTGKRAVALEVNGSADGKEAGVAFLDDPRNLNSPSPWHLVAQTRNSFLFAQPAVLYYGEHRLEPKQRFTLRYRVIVHPGRWGAAQLTEAVETYLRRGKK